MLRGVVYRLIEYLASMGHSSIWKQICAISVSNILTVGVHLSSTPSISGPGSATVSKVFSHFYFTLMVYVLPYMQLNSRPFCFYKSYQRIIRQQLYINTKYTSMKKYNNLSLNYIPMKTQQYCMPTSYSQYFVASPVASIRSAILIGIEL